MQKPFWASLFLLSYVYSVALADGPTSESKGWGGVAPTPSENECRSFIEAALKEQRSQADEGDGGSGNEMEGVPTTTHAEQTHIEIQLDDGTTAEALTEDIGPTDTLNEINEKISDTDSKEAETSEYLEEAGAKAIDDSPVEPENIDGIPTESVEPETTSAESFEPGTIAAESVEPDTVAADSAESDKLIVDSAESEKLVVDSAESEKLVVDSAESEKLVDSAESESLAAATTEDDGSSVEAKESVAAMDETLAESSEAEITTSQTTENEEALAESTEAQENESIEVTTDGIEKETEALPEGEPAENVYEEFEKTRDDVLSEEETVRDASHERESDGTAEDVTPESAETEKEELQSNEEDHLSEQQVEEDTSTEAAEDNMSTEATTTEEEPALSEENEIAQTDATSEPPEEEPATGETEEAVSSAETTIPTVDEEVAQESLENESAESIIPEQTDANELESIEKEGDSLEKEATDQVSAESVTDTESSEKQQVTESSENVQPTSDATTESAAQEQSPDTSTSHESTAEQSPVDQTTQEDTVETSLPSTDALKEAEQLETRQERSVDETSDISVTEPTEAEKVQQDVATQLPKENEKLPETTPVAVAVDTEEEIPEQEDLTLKIEIPENLRSRTHITELLRLDIESVDIEAKLLKAEEVTLRELKRVYEAAIKPLEILYKYRDLSNRHFGDPEIFSKPLILFMGPWSGGKSTIINYLLDNEYKNTALRTGAEPSPAYFNIVMWGEREEVLDGTQLAADWTFSGLQKFGQGLLDRLRGLKLNSSLLEKVNIVEIPGILEIRKQVERLFPLNDACQWFIDRADIIFLVYDPSKLDVGPETEAILDQLKGREYQTKIILNKADQVKPEELMRVQGTLIWNISPLMSSTEPPVMYSTSLWSHPYQLGSPSRLLFAQEKAFLKDLREAMEKRVENKISSARRFAVRVRNHAKMVDCYLTTYYNHKTFFGDKQKVSEDIIEHPQNYHIYEGLSTLTNISRYDLPDPDVYRDFFRLNPVYDFQQLASTCTYFKGCPINRLDVAIAYDLPELVGKYKKTAEDIVKGKKGK